MQVLDEEDEWNTIKASKRDSRIEKSLLSVFGLFAFYTPIHLSL